MSIESETPSRIDFVNKSRIVEIVTDNRNRLSPSTVAGLSFDNAISLDIDTGIPTNMTSDPTKCTVLYKILTPDEHAGLSTSDWKGTSLDVRSHRNRVDTPSI
jgi:hypothetical protein